MWEELGTTNETSTLNVDLTKYKEVKAYSISKDKSAYRCFGIFPTDLLDSTSPAYIGLGGDDFRVSATKSYVALSVFVFNGTNYTQNSETHWYAR